MRRINLLILDDKEENIISLKALLEDIPNIKIIVSTDPNDALKICWKEHISIALVDVQMPDINGFEFVSLLKANPKTSHIMAIMVTAISKEDKYLLEGLRSGAVDYLFKPLNPDITRAKVNSFVRQVRLQEEINEKNRQLERSQEELVSAKEEAEHARKSKEIFLANMSHEIRTPINGITGIIHMLKGSSLNAEQIDWLDMLDNASQSLLVVINDILDLSRIESGKFKIENEDFSLNDFIDNLEHVYKIKADHKGLDFVIQKSPDLPEFVVFDALRLQQIISNFISNSLKFTEVGQIILRIDLIEHEDEQYRIRFAVKDSGIGIRPDHLSKIFQAFEQGDGAITKRYGGTGLGLTIVKRLAELLDGEVGAQSDLGKGATFHFEASFAKSSKPILKKGKDLYVNFPKISNVRILVAEDNDLNAFMLVHMLKTWGCIVDVVKNGQMALEHVNRNHYDIILMDTHMPVMSGFEAIKEIKKNVDIKKRNIPIITISASVLQHEQAAAYEVGAQDVIGKPYDPSNLYDKIKKHLRTEEDNNLTG